MNSFIIKKIKKIPLFYVIFIFALLFPAQLWAEYYKDGILISSNLISTGGISTLNNVVFVVSDLPAGTSAKVQLSYDGVNGPYSTGIAGSWTTLDAGTTTIDFSSQNIRTSNFYYKLWMSSTDGLSSPVLKSVTLSFINENGTYYTYSSSGVLTSTNILNTDSGNVLDSFSYLLSSLPTGTAASIQFSNDNSNWYSSAGVLNASNTLAIGNNTINLSGLDWFGGDFYYKVTFNSDSQNKYTPILSRVTLSYTSSNYYWVGAEGAAWENAINWSGRSGGAGGAGIPGGNDAVYFDANDTHSAIIENDVNVKTINIDSGYSGVISQSSTTVITTSGAVTQNDGTLTLSGANAIAGGVILNSGRLNINGPAALGTTTLTLAGGSIDNTSGGSVTISPDLQKEISANFSFLGSNALNLGAGTTTLTATSAINISSSTLVIDGKLEGASAFRLIKNGNGSLTLNGDNTFSGGTSLNAGTLNVSNTSALGSADLKILSNGIVNFFGDITVTNDINSTGTINFFDSSIANSDIVSPNGEIVFNDSSFNGGFIEGDAKFAFATSGVATLSGAQIWGTVSGHGRGLDGTSIDHWVFNENSRNNSTSTIGAGQNMIFNDSGSNIGNLTVESGGVVDFYENSTNEGNINIASGGIVNFHDDAKNQSGSITIASGGTISFKDRSVNISDGTVGEAGSSINFYDTTRNNGDIVGNVTYFDDLSEGTGTVIGSTTRQFNSAASTTRDFTTEQGHGDWILIAQGAIVDVSQAIYNLATNLFKAFNSGLFYYGSNSSGGPVMPEISISSPLDSATTTKWLPIVFWDDSTKCEYKIDGGTYSNLDCSKNGLDIPRPSSDEHELFIRGTDVKGNLSEISVNFTYDNTQPTYTLCGTDLLDESTRPYYYLRGNITGNCVIAANNVELRGSTSTISGGHTVSGDILGEGYNFTLKNISVNGKVSSNATTTGGDAGNIVIENASITATTSANGADGDSNLDGGDGGNINIATSTTDVISASGGDPNHNGGNAGVITVVYSYSTVNGTPILANGGDSSGCGYGGSGGNVILINSSGYSISNEKGIDSLSSESCSPTGTAGHSGEKSITGEYIPPSNATPGEESDSNNSPTTQSAGTTAFSLAKLGQMQLSLANIKPLSLKALPVFGGKDINSFSFECILEKYIFEPLSSISNKMKSATSLVKFLGSQGLKTQQDLINLKNRLIRLVVPEVTPKGLYTVEENGKKIPFFAGFDKHFYLIEKVLVNASTSNVIYLDPLTKSAPKTEIDNLEYVFGSNEDGFLTIKLPNLSIGTHILTTNASPLPLIIEVVPQKKENILIEKVKEQKVWKVLKFW